MLDAILRNNLHSDRASSPSPATQAVVKAGPAEFYVLRQATIDWRLEAQRLAGPKVNREPTRPYIPIDGVLCRNAAGVVAV